MTDEFDYTFEELPLVTERGWQGGLVSGAAVISYYDDGEWFVRGISLDAYRKRGDGTFERGRIEIEDRKSEIYRAIWSELTDGSFKDSVDEAVRLSLEENEIVPHSDYDEHNTLNKAMQGM